MSIDTFLAQHGASAAPRPQRSAEDKVLGEIAAQAVLSRDAEQLLRAVGRSLRHDAESLCIRLDAIADAESPVAVVARRLSNIGVLSFVRRSGGDEPSLFAMVSKLCPERVRSRVKELEQQGRWLELGAAELVRSVAENAGLKVEIATQMHVNFLDGTDREVDVFVCTGDEALLIECKSGHLGIHTIGRFSELAGSLGIGKSHTLVLGLTLDQEAAADLKAFYPVTVVPREHLKNIVSQRLAAMATRAASDKAEPEVKPATKKAVPKKAVPKKVAAKKAAAQQKPVVKKAPSKMATPQAKQVAKKTASKKAVAPPKPAAKKADPKAPSPPAQRKVVAPELIESALIAAANASSPPANLGVLVGDVRDELWCTSKAAKDSARKLLAKHVFLDKHDEVVRDFSTPIHAVQAATPSTEQPA